MDIKDTSNWITVNYEYTCPSENYLDGPNTESVSETYFGPREIYVPVHNETGKIYDVWIHEERFDGRPTPFNHTIITVLANETPLVAEVLSDYHNNFEPEDMRDDHLELRQIGIAGYTQFEYTWPIHPDELYDDSRSYYDWNTESFVLVRMTNDDNMGAFPGWDANRERRNFLLERADQWLLNPTLSEEKIAEINDYKQKLRDFPDLWAASGYDDIFSDSCWPVVPTGCKI